MLDAFKNGEKIEIIPVERITDLQRDLSKFRKQTKLNGFQEWIVDDLYNYKLPEVDYTIKSIILVAVPHPLYADVELTYNSKTYNTCSVVMSDFKTSEESIKRTLKAENHNYTVADNIPLKRIAVQSGFAKYGRNNICYIDGLGSYFSFIAFFSDIESTYNYWSDIKVATECSKCRVCLNNCPTGAIKEDTFLIDTDRCLSFWNESSEPFPTWIPESAHHTIYDCIKCQDKCPMNRGLKKRDSNKIYFSEDETRILLSGSDNSVITPTLKKKIDYLGLDQWPDGIPKNLRILFNMDINSVEYINYIKSVNYD